MLWKFTKTEHPWNSQVAAQNQLSAMLRTHLPCFCHAAGWRCKRSWGLPGTIRAAKTESWNLPGRVSIWRFVFSIKIHLVLLFLCFLSTAISPIWTASAIQVASALLSRSPFQCSFERHANSGLVQAHNPAFYSEPFINSFVWDDKLNCLAKEIFVFSFNKNAAPAYVYNQALLEFLFVTPEKDRSNIGYPGKFAGIADIFNAGIKNALIFGINHIAWI